MITIYTCWELLKLNDYKSRAEWLSFKGSGHVYIVIIHSDDVTGYVTKCQLLNIISIINWFVFVCFNYATKNNMLGSNILDKATILAWCFNCFDTC